MVAAVQEPSYPSTWETIRRGLVQLLAIIGFFALLAVAVSVASWGDSSELTAAQDRLNVVASQVCGDGALSRPATDAPPVPRSPAYYDCLTERLMEGK